MSALSDALADLIPLVARMYQTPAQARSVAGDVGLPEERVRFDQAAEAVWRDLVHLARLRRKLPALLKRVAEDYPTAPQLAEAFAAVHLALATDDGTDDVLSAGTERLRDDPAPSQILDARHAVVPWHEGGRKAVLEALEAWAAEPARVSVWLVHAEGGVGKTRLGIEWCRRLRARQRAGEPAWCAGFLAKDAPVGWYDDLCAWGISTMVVVDYAESRPELLGALRGLLKAHAAGGSPPLRVLLLARSDGDWWTQLTDDRDLGPLLRDRTPQVLAPVAEAVADREKVLREAVSAFAQGRSPTPAVTEGLQWEDARFDRVLYLHMAALALVEGIDVPVGQLMDAILDHEERFWERRGREGEDGIEVSQHRAQARQLVAAATLRGGFATRDDARAVAKRMADRALDRDDDRLVALLCRIYQRGTTVALAALEPDLLGEAMTVRVGAPVRAEEAAPSDWIDRIFLHEDEDASVETGFTVLGRASVWTLRVPCDWMARMLQGPLAIRAPQALAAAKRVGQQTAYSQLGDLLADALDARGDRTIGAMLARVGVPQETVSLRRVGAWVALTQIDAEDHAMLASVRTSPATALPLRPLRRLGRWIWGVLRRVWMSANDEQAVSERAGRLIDLGVRLGALGRREDALAATEEAVAKYRTLAARNPDAFLPNLAASLNNLGMILNALGRREDALAATEEAVAIRRTLAARKPDAFIPDLAMSLNNLGMALDALGRREDALASTEEAVAKYRTLAARNPDAFLPNLAMSLNNLGMILNALGRREDALAATEEAVAIRRTLAARNPDAFIPDLASSLNNLGMALDALGRREDALAATEEAVAKYRTLAARNPDAFLPDLATSYESLGISQLGMNDAAGALGSFVTGAELIEPLRTGYPDALNPRANSLAARARALLDTLGPDAPLDLVRRLEALSQRDQPPPAPAPTHPSRGPAKPRP